MTQTSYQLEHFIYGPFVRKNKPDGEPRLLALSTGLKQEEAGRYIGEVNLPPLEGVPEGAWAVVRGQSIPFLMVQSQKGEAGQVMTHYTLIPSEALRALGGNIGALRSFLGPDSAGL